MKPAEWLALRRADITVTELAPPLVSKERHAPPDPFRSAVDATLAPAPPKTRRVYLGGGL